MIFIYFQFELDSARKLVGIRTMQLRLRMHHDLLVTRLVNSSTAPRKQPPKLQNLGIRNIFQLQEFHLVKVWYFGKLISQERERGGSLNSLGIALTECNGIICFLRDQVHGIMTLTDYDGLQTRRHRVLQRRVFYSKV